jgi:cell division protease FtsH
MQATDLARRMVTEWGMSEKLGPLRYNENQQEVFLGHSVTQSQNMSEDTARLIDEEIRRIVTEGAEIARDVVTTHRRELEAITQALMEYETISGDEVRALMRGEKIVRRSDDEDPKDVGGITSAVPTTGARSNPREEDPGTGGMEPQPQA